MHKKTPVLAALTAAFAAALAPSARAQTAPGFSVDRFNPSERGSEWFVMDTLDMRGGMRPAAGIVGEWADKPFILKNADGSTRATIVDQQLFIHPGASLVLMDRIRLGFNVPVALIDNGGPGTATDGQVYAGPTMQSAGDARIGADIRVVGTYASPFTLALGGQFFLPTGEAKKYTGDDLSSGILRAQAAGEAGLFAYSVNLGYHIRAQEITVDGHPYGSGIIYGAAAGVRLADHNLLIGPEIYGEANTSHSGAFFQGGSTPLEAILGAHYTIAQDWRVGGGAGPGITHDLGSPTVRVLLSFEWTPAYHEPPPPPAPVPPPVADRDGDGIPDSDDACPDKPGIKTDDPKTNGCPAPPADRDGDGIPDADDACPDKPGVKTDDPKTNGCPADRDGDGIPDAEDACPDKPGVKTDNPKTNGCPADRDGDGITDADDACPDAPGPHTDDPKTNGCPKAAVVNGQIKISEQVKFATGSAKILADSNELLAAVADVIVKHPDIKKVRIEGHTDNVGKPASNKALSRERAQSVMKWLAAHGIPNARMSIQGFGQEKPIDDNSTEAGRRNNRRVEFHIE